jgi:Bacterial lectin
MKTTPFHQPQERIIVLGITLGAFILLIITMFTLLSIRGNSSSKNTAIATATATVSTVATVQPTSIPTAIATESPTRAPTIVIVTTPVRATTTPNPTSTSIPPTIDFSQGFGVSSQLKLNGGATIAGNALLLTDGAQSEGRSAFVTTTVPVHKFTTNFRYQATDAVADGITFMLQNSGPTAIGSNGSDLASAGIAHSVAIKLDLWSNNIASTTGIYTNGASPTSPETILNNIDLHSSHVFAVQITYQNATLALQIKDESTGATAQLSFSIDIESTIGNSNAYVGFTGATGALTAHQSILDWTYNAQ